ncbi:conserved hypothetical protein [Rhodospirillaceae bacterium LM-1]|nr:conserved hypothetical protein [Rhodospirillaceae bacterium LM-1]
MSVHVCFINIPSGNINTIAAGGFSNNNLSVPLGILYLSSYIKKFAPVSRVSLIDYASMLPEFGPKENLYITIKRLAQNSVEGEPDIIGVSMLFTAALPFFKETVRAMREIYPRSLIVVGGNHATARTDRLLDIPEVDLVVRGEGEIALAKIIEAHAACEPKNITGVYSRETLPKERQNWQISQWVDNLDELPMPDWGLIDMESYLNDFTGRRRNLGAAKAKRFSTIMTSRGCPFSCTFCGTHTVHGRRMRYNSIDRVCEEVMQLHRRYGANLIVPEDDFFTGNKKRTTTLLNSLMKLGIPDLEIQFTNGLSVNTLDEDIIDAMIGAGMHVCELAIESGSEYVQREIIKKRVNLTKAREIVRLLRAKNIYSRCFFILGFAGETREQMEETIEYAKSLEADWCAIARACPLPGTEMFDQFVKMGVFQDDDERQFEPDTTRLFDTPEISAHDLNELADRFNIEVNFFNNVNLRLGNWDKVIDLFMEVVLRFPFHIVALHGIAVCHVRKGNHAEAERIFTRVIDLISTDTDARAMWERYHAFMPELEARIRNGQLPHGAT